MATRCYAAYSGGAVPPGHEWQRGVDVRLHLVEYFYMRPFDIQTIGKLDAAIQQVEAAIELFYAKQYAPAITLAAAAEGCLPRRSASDRETSVDAEGDLQGPPEPLFEMMKEGAKERYDMSEREAANIFNALVHWLKHETLRAPATAEVSNYDAWTMICRAVTKIEHTEPGSETPAIASFIEFSRQHYSEFTAPKSSPTKPL